MYNETEKLDRFKNAVFDNADVQVRKIIKKAENEAKSRLKKAEHDAESYKNGMCGRCDSEENAKAVREISSLGLEEKRRLLLRREELISNVFEKVKSRLEDFQKSAEYEDFLIKKVSECVKQYPDEKGTVYLCHKDMKFAEKLSFCGKFDVCENETFELGGVMVIFDDNNIAFDYTFDACIQEECEKFTERRELILDGREEM